jgi:hypothetical protein
MIPQPEVQQVDRQSASSLEPNGRERDQILRGKRDHTATVRAFAAHRAVAYEAGRREGVREAAEVARTLELFQSFGCPVCSGDCGSSNPPILKCPMQAASNARAVLAEW